MVRRSRSEQRAGTASPQRNVDYQRLRNPFPQMKIFSDDKIAAIHEAALDNLETLGIKVLLPQARDIYVKAGARLGEDDMIYLGRDIVQAALDTAPKSFALRGIAPQRDLTMELGTLAFQCGAAAPHVTDLRRGRRPGRGSDYTELVKLVQSFDVLHMMPPITEAQDIPTAKRHYFTLQTHLQNSDKIPFVYSRGTPQVTESFALLRDFKGLSDDQFTAEAQCYTIINTNSPRMLDTPMAQGLIDFARAGQMAIITPFTLIGAMAPITVGGAITLSHTEALAAITLSQLAKPGAPVCYGTFTSNVDMKSGSPTFGTPEHMRASLAAGQLARLIGLPWRSAAGSAATSNDVQAANENQFGLWGCLLAGASIVIHAAGWIEGGLTISYEKFISDIEVLNMVAEMCSEFDEDIGLDAIAEVAPGGHFFAAGHTMSRYKTAFYEPILHDYANFGSWQEAGARDASTRATDIWERKLADFTPAPNDPDKLAELDETIAKWTARGGAEPVS